MKRILNKSYIGIGTLLNIALVACLPLLSSCYNDDYSDCDNSTVPATIRLYISANGLGDLNATRDIATDGTEDGDPGEFINSLCVFIVDASDGTIEYKFNSSSGFNATQRLAAATGDLQALTIDLTSEGIPVGNKIIYAFANWENANCSDWSAIISDYDVTGVNTTLTAEDLNFYIEDPAGNVSLGNADASNNKYIPMSGMTTATISEDLNYTSQLISLGLDRLVSKVRVYVNAEADDGDGDTDNDFTINALTVSGFADYVPLFDYTALGDDSYKPGSGTTVSYDNKTYILVSADGTGEIIKEGSGKNLIGTIYVNESYSGTRGSKTDGFTVDITLTNTNEYGKTGYTATTSLKDIPRNYIYPLTLSLDDYVFAPGIKAYTAPIGSEEFEYSNFEMVSSNTYKVRIIDGTTKVTLSPTMKENDLTIQSITWTLTLNTTDNDGENLTILNGSTTATSQTITSTDGTATFTITDFTGAQNYTYTRYLTLTGTWTDTNGLVHTRTYYIYFETKAGGGSDNDDPFGAKALFRWWEESAGSEVLNMRRISFSND